MACRRAGDAAASAVLPHHRLPGVPPMLPSGSLPMPAEWRGLLEDLAPVFARRSTHRLFMALACCPSPVRLPARCRLWRGKGTASQVQLAAGLLELLVKAFPGRQVHGTGDAAFHGEPLVIKGSTWTTRLPASAVISGPKPPP